MWTNGSPTIGTPRPTAPPTGGLWNNAGPQINVNYQAQRPQAFGFQQPQYRPQHVTMGAQTQQPFNPGYWNGGAGGVNGNGMVSTQTYADVMGRLMEDKYQSAVQAWNRGELQNTTILAQLRNEADRLKNIAYNGRSEQMFQRPQFEEDEAFAQWNEAARQWGNTTANVENYLPLILRGRNQGQTMRPWTATGLVDSNFGSGNEGNYVAGGIVRNVSNTAPTDPNRPTAFSNPYNGGDLRTASAYGSYLQPLSQGGGYTSPGASRGEPYNPFPGGLRPIGIDPNTGEMGRYDWSDPYHDRSGWRRDNTGDYPTRAPGFSPQYDENGRAPLPGGGYIQDTPNGPYEVDRFGRRISSGTQVTSLAAMALPYGPPTTVQQHASNEGGYIGPYSPAYYGSLMSEPSFAPIYDGPYSPAHYNNLTTGAAILGGLLGSDRGPTRRGF